jgi:alginate O-acetyltransferase complex protein AlgI
MVSRLRLYPDGGNRRGPWRTQFNLVVVFLLCGLWHGASWNFAVWGLYHGLFLMLERTGFQRILRSWPFALRHLYVVIVVIISWVPFRTASLTRMSDFLGVMFGSNGLHLSSGVQPFPTSAVVAFCVGALLSVWPPSWSRSCRPLVPVAVKYTASVVLLVCSAASLAAGTYNPFIYFRF